jgi:Na+/proline symporter
MMCKEVLPAGMLGLMLISLVFATNSSVQGVLNISAGVITNDLYKNKFPDSSEKKLMFIAKSSTLIFGLLTIGIAMLVPLMGGAKEVVLSVAALTGCPMYLPLIWSLYSKKQTGFTTLLTTMLSLAITLSFKFLLPLIQDTNLSREGEMILGVGVPAFILLMIEIILRMKKYPETEYLSYLEFSENKPLPEVASSTESAAENKQGLKMIALGILATGLIIGALGAMAQNGKAYVLGMAVLLLIIGYKILPKPFKVK